jgi:hypothetical protein
MTGRQIIVVWFVIVSVFAAYGFFGPGSGFGSSDALISMLFTGVLGITAATGVATGIYVTGIVRAKAIGKIVGILVVAVSAVIGAGIPPTVLAYSGLFNSEAAILLVYFEAAWALCIGALGFVISAVAILRIH